MEEESSQIQAVKIPRSWLPPFRDEPYTLSEYLANMCPELAWLIFDQHIRHMDGKTSFVRFSALEYNTVMGQLMQAIDRDDEN